MDRRLQNETISAKQLATNVAESMSAPATTLLGYCELLLQKPDLDDNIRTDLRVIRDYARQTVDIVNRLWSFSGRRYHRPRPVRVQDLWSAISTELQISLAGRFELKVLSRNETSVALVDRASLERGILSLANNALSVMSEAGRFLMIISETTIIPSGEPVFSPAREMYSVAEIRVSGLTISSEHFLNIEDPLFRVELVKSGSNRVTSISSFYEELQEAGVTVDSNIGPNGDVRFQIFLRLLDKMDSPYEHGSALTSSKR